MGSSWGAGWLRPFTKRCWFQRCSGCRSHVGVEDHLTSSNNNNRTTTNNTTTNNRDTNNNNREGLKERRKVEQRLGSPHHHHHNHHHQQEARPALRWRGRWLRRSRQPRPISTRRGNRQR